MMKKLSESDDHKQGHDAAPASHLNAYLGERKGMTRRDLLASAALTGLGFSLLATAKQQTEQYCSDEFIHSYIEAINFAEHPLLPVETVLATMPEPEVMLHAKTLHDVSIAFYQDMRRMKPSEEDHRQTFECVANLLMQVKQYLREDRNQKAMQEYIDAVYVARDFAAVQPVVAQDPTIRIATDKAGESYLQRGANGEKIALRAWVNEHPIEDDKRHMKLADY